MSIIKDNIKYLAILDIVQKTLISDFFVDEQNKIFSEDVFLLLAFYIKVPRKYSRNS